MKLYLLSLVSVAPLVAAHFKLDYPKARGENEDLMTTFSCGSLPNPLSAPRSLFPMAPFLWP